MCERVSEPEPSGAGDSSIVATVAAGRVWIAVTVFADLLGRTCAIFQLRAADAAASEEECSMCQKQIRS